MHRTAAFAMTALSLSLAVSVPAPASAGVLSWLIAGAGTACATSERCAGRAHAAKDAAITRFRTDCSRSAGCSKLARDAGDLRAHVAQGGRGFLARLFARRSQDGVQNSFQGQMAGGGLARP